MRTLQSLVRRITRSEDPEAGAALPFVAVLLVLLLGVSAFAVDLGWIYLNGARLQRAADSSALAGVVFLPSNMPEVVNSAIDGASANGWDVGTVNGAPIAGGGPDELEWQPLDDNRLEVTLRASVPTFFLRVLGFDDFDLSRTATAEYVKPVPIGSPFHNFGDGTGNFWGAINGRWTAAIQGDPYNAFCDWVNGFSDSNCRDSSVANRNTYWPSQTIFPGDVDPDGDDENPQFHGLGYYYGVEIQDNRDTLRVDLFDPRFRRPSGGCNFDFQTGDCDRLSYGPSSSSVAGPTTRYRLYAPDSTPLDPRDNSVLLCNTSYTATTDGAADGVWEWDELCTLNDPDAGIYVLRVSTSNGSGSNQYGVRAVTTGPGTDSPLVYGIDQISIFTNQDASTATLYLAEVDPVHAGKVLELKFFDAGEDDEAASYSVKLPDGTTANCEWESEDGLSGGPGVCTIVTTMNNPSGGGVVGRFNSQWLTAYVDIPEGYSCDLTTTLGCWWSMSIVNSSPHDRTTWTAKIIGNPVHLVPNEP